MRKLVLVLVIAMAVFVLAGCDHPSWANFEVIVKDKEGEIIESHYCITAEREGTTFYCRQPEEAVVEIEIEPGYKVQIWTLPKPM